MARSRQIRYASICSGIEAASVAVKPLGWECAFVAEIEPFCCELLSARYPEVENLGDITAPDFIKRARRAGPIDVLVGGPPCQAFSIAGLRGGLADPRGNLTLTYLAVVDALRPAWFLYENVPGLYSAASHVAPDPRPPEISLDGPGGPADGEEIVVSDEYDADEEHAFACLLAGVSELGYGYAWATLDAQYFDLAQRRERLFLVGCAGGWQAAAAVLVDPESLSGHPAPSRKPRQSPADVSFSGAAGGGVPYRIHSEHSNAMRSDSDGAVAEEARVARALDSTGGYTSGQGGNVVLQATDDISLCLSARTSQRSDSETESLVAVAFDTTQITSQGNRSNPQPGEGVPTVAFNLRGREGGASPEISDLASIRAASGGSSKSYIATPWAVRRLTPFETEILMGFEPGYTFIDRARARKIDPDEAEYYLRHGVNAWQDGDQWWTRVAADASIYKAHGNSFAVPVVRWIAERIQLIHEATHERNIHGTKQTPR